MERIAQHVENPVSDELTGRVSQAVRDAVRAELAEAGQRRRMMMYAGAGAAALYAGAAVALALGLVLALGLPDWGAALIVAAVLGVAAYALRTAARPGRPEGPEIPPMPSDPPR
ncbi:phage holin family protein [Streptomyces sp. NPDC052225]|uniref:phage holin family protein n=1 Tax=Streptomyces sp. NPDC052225 TaxID=3154949 RepID=UPI003439733B